MLNFPWKVMMAIGISKAKRKMTLPVQNSNSIATILDTHADLDNSGKPASAYHGYGTTTPMDPKPAPVVVWETLLYNSATRPLKAFNV
jgi:hypothetical protein